MARRSGLGKGLGALIPSDLVGPSDDATLRELLISQIEPNQHQPRAHFDEEALVSLTDSIRELGVLQPVLVRPAGPDRFELIAGERRWRAAKRAGLHEASRPTQRLVGQQPAPPDSITVGGEGGIRTHGRREPPPVFKSLPASNHHKYTLGR